ncbi:hypothetical protein JCM10450v2_006773 [Rhodotorula kratochvilovae]
MPRCFAYVGSPPLCRALNPSTIPPFLAAPDYVPLPFAEARAWSPPWAPAIWSLELEMQFQVFDTQSWIELSLDDRADQRYMANVEHILGGPGAHGYDDYAETVQMWDKVAARRLVRWQRLKALGDARALFIHRQQQKRPGWTEADVLTRSPDLERFVRSSTAPAPARSVWPLPSTRPLTSVLSAPSSRLRRATSPGFDLAPFFVSDQRILTYPPVPAVRLEARAGDPGRDWAHSRATLVDVQGLAHGGDAGGALMRRGKGAGQ